MQLAGQLAEAVEHDFLPPACPRASAAGAAAAGSAARHLGETLSNRACRSSESPELSGSGTGAGAGTPPRGDAVEQGLQIVGVAGFVELDRS